MLTEIERRLEALTRMQALRKELIEQYEQAKRNVIPDEVEAALCDLETEYAPMFGNIDRDIAAVEAEVKAAVAKHGATVSAAGLVAQFNHGRVTYDSKRLDGLALAFPQINECKKVGDPYVVLKPVKG